MHQHLGILILGHGTPSDQGTKAFLKLLHLVKEIAGETPVAAGFMEFASPTIAEGAAALLDCGVRRVVAVPVFLSAAGHTANDLPQGIAQAKKNYPHLKIELTPHVGGHPKVAELSALRYREAIAGRAEVPAEQTLVVLAAHGSPEPEAFEELENFARAREKLAPGIRIVPCFSQMGAPLLQDVLPALVEPTFRRIVVQPHFLLPGRMIEAIAHATAAVAGQHAEIEWIVAAPLGSHRLLAEAVLDLGRSES
ncbi:MAG: sirohydrochlorin chelatase [Pirellulales bacterium]|nr:sirohydrochlorin chelatase [Pirellulales bacterium]